MAKEKETTDVERGKLPGAYRKRSLGHFMSALTWKGTGVIILLIGIAGAFLYM